MSLQNRLKKVLIEVKEPVKGEQRKQPLYKVWWQAIRPVTLGASIGPVLLANSWAYHHSSWRLWVFIVTLMCALSLQVLVNLSNDLSDGLSGVDSDKRLGPKRMFASGLLTSSQLRVGIYIVLVLALALGLALIVHGGLGYLLLGAAALVGALCYSGGPVPLADRGLGEFLVFVYFGWLAVVGSFHLQTFGSMEMILPLFGYGTVVGLLSAAMMLVNNVRDKDSDQNAGKITLAVRLGRDGSISCYRTMLISAFCLHIFLSLNLPLVIPRQNTLVTWIPMLLSVPYGLILCWQIGIKQGSELNVVLADTGKLGLSYCVCVAAVVVYSLT